jgi:beta-N-acetylhexosaminidase
MIMTAHIQYPALEDTTMASIADGSEVIVPATLSRSLLTGLVRGRWGSAASSSPTR